MQNEHGLAPVNAPDEEAILAAEFLGREKLLVHTITIDKPYSYFSIVAIFAVRFCLSFFLPVSILEKR